MMSIESIKARLEAGYVMPEPNALKAVDAQQRERDLRALLKVAEAAEARMEMWTAETYADLRAALTALREAQS